MTKHLFSPAFLQIITPYHRSADLSNKYGLGGYDNSLESMQSLVILRGPGVQRSQGPGHTTPPSIDAVDMFPLLAHLLELPDIPSNGSLNAVRSLLKNPPTQSIEAIKKVIEKYISGHEKFPKAGWFTLHTSFRFDIETLKFDI